MNYLWATSPFIRLLIPIVLGIVGYRYIHTDMYMVYLPVTIITLSIHLWGDHTRRFIQIFYSIFAFIAFLLLGCTKAHYDNNIVLIPKDEQIIYTGKVLSIDEQNNWFRLIIKARATISHDGEEPPTQKMILRLKKDTLDPPYLRSIIAFKTQLTQIDPPKNPFVFDFSQYWQNKHIRYQSFIDRHSMLVINEGQPRWIDSVRKYIKNQIDLGLKDRKTNGVAHALLLGDKSNLDPDIKSAYTQAGAMHVLAVSGLHVALIAGLFMILLYPIKRTFPAFAKRINLLTIIGVWIFAVLCNLSPSVTRAAIMLTLFIIAEAMDRRYYGVNILSFTAFILLAIDTYYIYDIGFQLSFLAVFGILIGYPPIFKSYIPSHFVVQKLWSMTAVTLSAQLFIFPLLLYYFHKIPVYFIPNSLIAVSGLSLILYSGILMLAVSWNEVLFSWAATVFEHLILYLNRILAFNNEWAWSSIEDIWIDSLDLALLMMVSSCISARLLLKDKRFSWIGLFLFLSFSIHYTYHHYQKKEGHKLIVYSDKKTTSLDLIVNSTTYSFSRDKNTNPFIHENLRSYYNTRKYIDLDLTDSVKDHHLYARNGFIISENKTICVLSKDNISYIENLPTQEIDILIPHGAYLPRMDNVLEKHRIHQIVTDCSSKYLKISITPNIQHINACTNGRIFQL